MSKRRWESGVTLVELIVTVAILVVLTSVAVVNLLGAARTARLDRGVQTTVLQMRIAREMAIDQRAKVTVTLNAGTGNAPSTITTRTTANTTVPVLQLPAGVRFKGGLTFPGSVTGSPDSITNTLNVSGAASLAFLPDGTAQNDGGGIVNGVVFIQQDGDPILKTRAISLIGATGRVRAFRLAPVNQTSYSWK